MLLSLDRFINKCFSAYVRVYTVYLEDCTNIKRNIINMFRHTEGSSKYIVQQHYIIMMAVRPKLNLTESVKPLLKSEHNINAITFNESYSSHLLIKLVVFTKQQII